MNKLLIALLLTPTLALAQTGGNASRIKEAEAPAEAPAAGELITFTPFTPLQPFPGPPAHACVQPPVAKAFASQKEADAFNAALSNYQACMKDYVNANTTAANAHAEAANNAVAEANAYIAEINSKFATPEKK